MYCISGLAQYHHNNICVPINFHREKILLIPPPPLIDEFFYPMKLLPCFRRYNKQSLPHWQEFQILIFLQCKTSWAWRNLNIFGYMVYQLCHRKLTLILLDFGFAIKTDHKAANYNYKLES